MMRPNTNAIAEVPAGLLFLVGDSRPRERVPGRQHLLRRRLHRRDRVAGAEARRRIAVDLGRRKAVEVRQQVGAGDPLGADQRGQRHHLAVLRARVEPSEVARVLPVLRVGLQDHPPDAAELVELARGERAELRLDRAVDVLDLHAQQRRLVAVDDGAQLLRVGAKRRRQAGELGRGARLAQEVLRDLVELRGIARARVLDPELEAAGGADAGNRRRRDREARSPARSSAPRDRSRAASRARSAPARRRSSRSAPRNP